MVPRDRSVLAFRFTVTLSPAASFLAGWKPSVMCVITCGRGGLYLTAPSGVCREGGGTEGVRQGGRESLNREALW